MASILRTTSLLIEENKEYEEIPEEETVLDFNFYKDEDVHDPLTEKDKIEFGITDKDIEEASQSAYTEVLQINEEEQKEQIVEQQIVERSKRERRKSQVILENEQQIVEDKALKEKQEQEKLKRKKPTIEVPIDSSFSQVSDIGDESGATSAHTLIIGNIRLETYNATSQAIAIYGDELKKFTTPDSPCALCGFPLKDRISYIHNRTHDYDPKQLTWSYDHFVPVNFSAVVFRIVTSKNYDIKELNLLKDNGYIVCYHCNYEKSQRLFVTCKKTGGKPDFNNFEPNTKTITKFVNDLYTSKNKHGWVDEKGNRTLIKCLTDYKKDKSTWKTERIEAITILAKKVCDNIIRQVNFEAVKERLKRTKLIVRKSKSSILNDARYKQLTNPKSKNRFRREYIAKLFAAAELKFRSPWNWKQPEPLSSIQEESEGESSSNLETTSEAESTPAEPQRKKLKTGGSRRKRTRKSKRKTYRRKRLF